MAPVREKLAAAAWLMTYRSPRTRRAYAGDLADWLTWLAGIGVDVLDARRVHVDLWVRQLLDDGAAHSSTTRRLSAVSSGAATSSSTTSSPQTRPRQ